MYCGKLRKQDISMNITIGLKDGVSDTNLDASPNKDAFVWLNINDCVESTRWHDRHPSKGFLCTKGKNRHTKALSA
jgi:hypothetical protein